MTLVQTTTMQNKHLEHIEDTILTGDLSTLDALLNPELYISTKIDGSPAIVWGTCPATGNFFVGTKSVFNKKKIKICYTQEDIFRLYDETKQASLIEILCACLKYLPRGEFIYQGDFIGFGGSQEYKPNTITYKFPETVRHTIIIAPHTEYVSTTTLAEAKVAGAINYNLRGNDECLFVQPKAYIHDKVNCFDDLKEVINYAKQMSTLVNFANDKQAVELKKQLNACIRSGEHITTENVSDFDCDRLLIEFWLLVKSIKDDALYLMRNDGPAAYLNGNRIDAEGYVVHSNGLMIKLVNREVFSYHNFNSGRFNAVIV